MGKQQLFLADNEKEMAAIDKRLAEVSPGKWTFHYDNFQSRTNILRPDDDGTLKWIGQFDLSADARFVIHAPEDVRNLAAEVRRLKAELLSAQFKAGGSRLDTYQSFVEGASARGEDRNGAAETKPAYQKIHDNPETDTPSTDSPSNPYGI
jgi:hypothetical protein